MSKQADDAVEKALAYYVSVFQDKRADPKRRDHAAKIVLLGNAKGAAIVLASKKRSLKEAGERSEAHVRAVAKGKAAAKKPLPKKVQKQRDMETAGKGSDFEGLL